MKAEAAECVRTALVLGLDGSELAARGQLAFLEREACRWTEADDAHAPACAQALGSAPTDTPLETVAVRARGAGRRSARAAQGLAPLRAARRPALSAAAAHRAARARDGRLRIGYLSADFHQHATSQLMAQMLECHDRSAFEVTLLSAGPIDEQPDAAAPRGAAASISRSCAGKSFQAMARAHPRARHRPPGRPQGRDLRHAAAGAGAAPGAAAGRPGSAFRARPARPTSIT